MEIRKPKDRAEHRAALARLIDPCGEADPLVQERVDTLENYARRRGLSLDHCLMLVEGSSPHAVCLCLDSPGRISSMLVSPGVDDPAVSRKVMELLEASEASAVQRNVQLLQSMVAPEASEESLFYAAAGFEHLATLLYLQNDLRQLPSLPARRTLIWETYSPQNHALFSQVIEATYQNSLDCGSLNGVRNVEDILASHRATGQYDPYYWRVGLAGNKPVGVILLSHMEEQHTLEVVYMGCLPAFRSAGYGSSLLAHGVELARGRGLEAMSLSVDEKNLPARKLYQTFGFQETMRRDVWIKIIGR